MERGELREKIRIDALSWVGTPFHHEAMVKGVGVDCIHLLVAVFSEVGMLPKVKPEHYAPDWCLHSSREILLEGIKQYAVEVQTPWMVGDILVYRYGRAASHCGIYIGDNQIVHAANRGQVRCELVANGSLEKRFVGGYRLCRLS